MTVFTYLVVFLSVCLPIYTSFPSCRENMLLNIMNKTRGDCTNFDWVCEYHFQNLISILPLMGQRARRGRAVEEIFFCISTMWPGQVFCMFCIMFLRASNVGTGFSLLRGKAEVQTHLCLIPRPLFSYGPSTSLWMPL